MKTVISLALMLSSSTLWAAAPKAPNCPRGTQAVYKCVVTPEQGDNEFATSAAQGISICRSGSKTVMAITVDGVTNSGEVGVESRAGGTTYSVSEDGVDLKFSVVTGVFQPTTKAKFFVEVKEARTSGSTTFTCK
jgi:hypothetical protein